LHAWVAFLLLSAAECFLLTLFPALNFIIIILWGATLILAGVYLDRRQLIIIYLADLVILFLFLGSESTMVIMLFFGIAGLTMSYLANAGKNYYFIQGSGMIAAMISVSLFLFLFYFGSDQTGSAQLDTELNIYMQEALDEFAQTDLFQLYKEQGITIEEMRAVFKQVAVIIYHHLPALYYLQAIMAVFFMLFFAHLASQTLSINRLRKKPYIMEIMPWQLVWVFIYRHRAMALGKGRNLGHLLCRVQYFGSHDPGSNLLRILSLLVCIHQNTNKKKDMVYCFDRFRDHCFYPANYHFTWIAWTF